jgi:hypothetical protein
MPPSSEVPEITRVVKHKINEAWLLRGYDLTAQNGHTPNHSAPALRSVIVTSARQINELGDWHGLCLITQNERQLNQGDTVNTDNTHGDIRYLDLWYPGIGDNPRTLQIALMHVRAADDIQVSYDMDRDGWVIKQASRFSWGAEDEGCDPDWQEVAFIQAWARKQEDAL